jgi:hypothetical protein
MLIFITTIVGVLLVFAGLRLVLTKQSVFTGLHPEHIKALLPFRILLANAEVILLIKQDPLQTAGPRGYPLSEKEKRWFGGGFAMVGLVFCVAAQLFL